MERQPVPTVSLTPAQRDALALSLVPGLGPRLTAALIRHLGSASAVLGSNREALCAVAQIGDKLAEKFYLSLQSNDVDAEIALLDRHRTRVITVGESEFPVSLAQIPDPPLLLYCRGTIASADCKAIAVVGTRHCSGYGRRMTQRLAGDIARAGFTVVSGLARGVDGIAHEAALEAGGRTIAVLAGGLSSIYPPEHVELSKKIESRGALVSETAMAMPPQRGMFHARNRIISGLARAVLVVEAGAKSGALITARHGTDQGREVFVVPGPSDSASSDGCHQLIRKGARLVRHIEDILEDLDGIPAPGNDEASLFSISTTAAKIAIEPPGLDDAGRDVWQTLADGPRHVDALARQLGRDIVSLTGTLMGMELKKIIRRLPGNNYERM